MPVSALSTYPLRICHRTFGGAYHLFVPLLLNRVYASIASVGRLVQNRYQNGNRLTLLLPFASAAIYHSESS